MLPTTSLYALKYHGQAVATWAQNLAIWARNAIKWRESLGILAHVARGYVLWPQRKFVSFTPNTMDKFSLENKAHRKLRQPEVEMGRYQIAK